MHITIEDLQAYLAHRYCGWANDQSMFMKLVEEMGEVAEVLNKRTGRKATENEDLDTPLGEELADMIHYIVAIAALNGLPLEQIMLDKDIRASKKYGHDINLTQFIEGKQEKSPLA